MNKHSIDDTRNAVYRVVSHIPRGKALTYGDVARLAGTDPRAVGRFLHNNPNPKAIPCHRIVDGTGRLAIAFAFGGMRGQTARLTADGVLVKRGRVDLRKVRWRPTRLFREFIGLYRRFGDPGPWPWFGQDRPHTPEEIAIGAILTQNTNWNNVEKALANLRAEKQCALRPITCLVSTKLRRLIRPSGFYHQKAARLAAFASEIGRRGGLLRCLARPTLAVRRDLLALNGIGPETADTILLYSGRHPIFVIDAYTRRFVESRNIRCLGDYDALQRYFMSRLPADVRLFQDFHALIVQWAKINK